MHTQLRPIAFAAARTTVLVAMAVMLILVLLPAVLEVQASS
jgi:hypothetical protein